MVYLKQLIFMFIVTLMNNCFSQTEIWGKYENREGAFESIDLKPDSNYYCDFADRCGGDFKDSGTYHIVLDTLFLKSYNITVSDRKFLIIKERNISRFTDTMVNSATNEKVPFSFYQLNSFVRIVKSDSILPFNFSGRLSDFECLSGFGYLKNTAYYDNGNLIYSIESSENHKTITNFYKSGQTKSIEHYRDDKKHGECLFFKENGEIDKIEKYKNNRLKHAKKKV